MTDRLVHHAEVVSLKGDSYRLKAAVDRRAPSGQAARVEDVVAVLGTASTRAPPVSVAKPAILTMAPLRALQLSGGRGREQVGALREGIKR